MPRWKLRIVVLLERVTWLVLIMQVDLILSYSYIFTDKLDHFDVIDLELDTTEEISEIVLEIQKLSDKYNIEIKQIKDISEEDNKYNSVKIVCKYNNKTLTKNKVITEFSSIQNLKNVSEVSN